MSKVSMIGTFTCVDGENEAMEAAMAAQVAAAADAGGVELYSYHRAGENNSYCFFALFSDQAAMEAHGNSEAMQAAMAAFGPLLAGPPDMTVAEPLTAHGFDI